MILVYFPKCVLQVDNYSFCVFENLYSCDCRRQFLCFFYFSVITFCYDHCFHAFKIVLMSFHLIMLHELDFLFQSDFLPFWCNWQFKAV